MELTSRNRPLMPRTQILQALRMLCKGCYHISIVVAFRMDGRKRFECATCGDAFSFFYGKRRRKISVFKKYTDTCGRPRIFGVRSLTGGLTRLYP